MRYSVFFFPVFIIVLSCTHNSEKSDEISQVDSTKRNLTAQTLPKKDSIASQQEIEKDTALENFDGICALPNIYPLVKGITSIKTTIIEVKDRGCIGDGCGASKNYYDPVSKTKLFIFKGNAYEYGFNDAEFYFRHDSLVFVREYNNSVNDFPTDTNNGTWLDEEKITILNPNSTVIKLRKQITGPREVPKLAEIPFKTSNADYKKTSAACLKKYQNLESYEGE